MTGPGRTRRTVSTADHSPPHAGRTRLPWQNAQGDWSAIHRGLSDGQPPRISGLRGIALASWRLLPRLRQRSHARARGGMVHVPGTTQSYLNAAASEAQELSLFDVMDQFQFSVAVVAAYRCA